MIQDSVVVPVNQYQQLLALLASHIAQTTQTSTDTHVPDNHVESGIVFTAHNQFTHSSSHWIVDSGATCYIAHNIASFSTMLPINGITVTLLNKTKIPVQFVGSVKFNSDFVLHNVFYVPHFNVNLFSVSAFLKEPNRSIIFLLNNFLIQDTQTLRMIGRGDLIEGLYVFKVNKVPQQSSDVVSLFSQNSVPVTCNIQTLNKVPIDVWHARLGHIFLSKTSCSQE